MNCGLCKCTLKEGSTWDEHTKSEQHQANLKDPELVERLLLERAEQKLRHDLKYL